MVNPPVPTIEGQGYYGTYEFTEKALNGLAHHVFRTERAKGFPSTTLNNLPEKIALVHSELSEALECLRNDTYANASVKVPEICNLEEEFADAIIRLLAMAASLELDIGKAVVLKDAYNQTRPYKHGKAF